MWLCLKPIHFRFTETPVKWELGLWTLHPETYLKVLREAMLVVGIELPDVFHELFHRDGLHVIWEQKDMQSHGVSHRTSSAGKGTKVWFSEGVTPRVTANNVLETSPGFPLR